MSKPEDYETEDPWGYKTNPCDQKRKSIIIGALKSYPIFNKALDVGAGEGWITQDIPAKEKFAFEQSENAKARLPKNVVGLSKPEGRYDLVIATGVLYPHYNSCQLIKLIKDHASNIILTCNIRDWEVPEVKTIGNQIYSEEFSYRDFYQKLRIFKIDSTS